MAFCSRCGKVVEDNIIFCPYCGKEIKAEPELKADPKDIADTRILALQAYLGLLVLEPLLAAPKGSVYARYHANQGLILLILDAISSVVSAIFSSISSIHWIFGLFFGPAVLAIHIVLIYLTVVGITHAVKGEMKPLPIIGKFKILK